MSKATIVAPALSLISNERTPGSAASDSVRDNLICCAVAQTMRRFESPLSGRRLIWLSCTAPRSNVPGALMVTSEVVPVSTMLGETVIAA
jgi:hypothetical protein